MTITAIREALGIISDHPERAWFAGPRDAGLVAAAEQALGFRFPAPYREFVETLGAGNFGSFEIFGLVDDNFAHGAVPNGIWLALEMRRRGQLKANLLPICDLGYGGYYCIERRDAGYPVVVVEDGTRSEHVAYEVEAPDFGEFFLRGIRLQLLN